MPANWGKQPGQQSLATSSHNAPWAAPRISNPPFTETKLKRSTMLLSAPPAFHPRHPPRLKRDGFPLPISFKPRGVPLSFRVRRKRARPRPSPVSSRAGRAFHVQGGRKRKAAAAAEDTHIRLSPPERPPGAATDLGRRIKTKQKAT